MSSLTNDGRWRYKLRLWLLIPGLLMAVWLGACGPAELEPSFGGPIPVTRESRATETLPGLQPAPSATPSPVQSASEPVTATSEAPTAFPPPSLETVPAGTEGAGETPTPWGVPSPWPTLTPVPPPAGLLYENHTGLWLVSDNWQPEQLPHIERGALLSPDTQKALLYEGIDMWLVDLSSGDRLNLSEGSGRVHCCAQWWPDRPGVIIFGSWPGSVDIGPTTGYLSAYNVDEGTYLVLDEETPSNGWAAPGPDGQRIAYDRAGTAWIYDWDQGPEALDPAGFGLQNVRRIGGPAWSPDGRKIAWTVAVEDPASGPWRIALAIFDLDTDSGRLLHPFDNLGRGGWFEPPSWSPDGQWMAFVAEDISLENYGLWVVATDGSREVYLGPGSNPIWSPDKHWLSYTAYSPELDPAEEVRLAEVGSWYSIKMNLPPGSTIRAWRE